MILKPLAAALAAVALLPGCVSQGSSRPSASPVRVATWNLEHLAAQNGTGCRPRDDAGYEALRAHAERIGADVVAFQEVENETAARRVFTPDAWTIVMSGRPPSGRAGACRENPALSIRNQAVGFAIRKGIGFTRNPDLPELGLGDPDLRWGVDITLDLPRPIRLLAVHLKSGCNSGQAPRDADCPILFRQANVLERWIDARARAAEDYAILGDWNRRTALPGDAFITEVSDDDPAGGRLVMADAGRSATCVARYRDFIDHIAVGERAAGRIVPGSFAEYRYGGVPEERHPSDHCPVSVALSSR